MLIQKKNNIAIVIALLFHICGAIGILFSPYKNWFISNTNLNLLLMVCLLIFTQPNINKYFFLFAAICFVVGITVEIIGVNTGFLFGNYTYGNIMGIKVLGVPLLIGVQWFVTVYCCGAILQFVNNWTKRKISDAAIESKKTDKIQAISLVIDAALLATFFDYIMEPVAQKLGYWQWKNNEIPFYNYTCWFFISAALLFILNKLSFNKLNQFAIHLFIIQLLFFIALRIYL
ncbi:MAG: carotenoid biosynthesis protein [Chitinophagaceae bacterium]